MSFIGENVLWNPVDVFLFYFLQIDTTGVSIKNFRNI